MAAPGYPKAISTPSSSRHFTIISAPLIISNILSLICRPRNGILQKFSLFQRATSIIGGKVFRVKALSQ